jgi:pimeloyl-ACP methyl ester carboxylesterase
MDLERVTVAGHSFGGGTSLGLVLRQAEARAERNRVRAAILFDGWMFPLEGSEGPAFDRVIPAERFDASVPVLFINAEMWQGSESYFMYVALLLPLCMQSVNSCVRTRLNKERIRQLCELSRGRWRSFTLKGTGHHNWNDFPSYAPIVSRCVSSFSLVPSHNVRLTSAHQSGNRLVGLTRERDLTAVHDDTMALVDSFLTDVLSGRGGALPQLDRVVSTILAESPHDVLVDDLPPQTPQ